MTAEAIAESRLTGNIDTYPCWDSEIHKKLKLKYYAGDVNTRIVNAELTQEINSDYNNRYFPPKSVGVPTLNTLLAERELYAKLAKEKTTTETPHFIEVHAPKFIPPLKNDRTIPEILMGFENAKMGSEDAQSKKNQKAMNDARKELQRKIDLEHFETVAQNITNKAINEAHNKLVAKNLSTNLLNDVIQNATSRFNSTSGLNYLPELEIGSAYGSAHGSAHSSPHSVHSLGTTHQSEVYSGFTGEPGFNEQELHPHTKKVSRTLKDNVQMLKNEGYTKANPLTFTNSLNKTYEIYVVRKGTGDTYEPVVLVDNVPVSHKLSPSQFQNILNEANAHSQANLIASSISGQGFKSKSTAYLTHKFNILKGEVMAGNDNPQVIKELQLISRELHAKGLLDSHL